MPFNRELNKWANATGLNAYILKYTKILLLYYYSEEE